MTLSAEDAELIKQAILHLRRFAIVDVHQTGVQAVLVIGHRCKICHSTWLVNETETHQSWCSLEGSNG